MSPLGPAVTAEARQAVRGRPGGDHEGRLRHHQGPDEGQQGQDRRRRRQGLSGRRHRAGKHGLPASTASSARPRRRTRETLRTEPMADRSDANLSLQWRPARHGRAALEWVARRSESDRHAGRRAILVGLAIFSVFLRAGRKVAGRALPAHVQRRLRHLVLHPEHAVARLAAASGRALRGAAGAARAGRDRRRGRDRARRHGRRRGRRCR